MPRNVDTGRATPLDPSSELRYIINQAPVTADVYRITSGDGVASKRVETKVSTFRANVTWERISGRELERTSQAGNTAPSAYLLIAEYPTDSLGRTVDLNRGDRVEVGGVSYNCTMIIRFDFKIEATLELRD